MNDVLDNIPKWTHCTIYADGLVIWCSEEYITVTVRMMEVLKRFGSTEKWLATITPPLPPPPPPKKKKAHKVFSLATKEQRAHLQVNGYGLPQDKTPTYLRRTFDPRITWKQQTDKYIARA